MTNESREFEVELELKARVATRDIDDIMCAALEGGITGWCRAAKPVGKMLGEYGHEQIARGGSLMLYDAESSDKWELTLDKFLRRRDYPVRLVRRFGVRVSVERRNREWKSE